MVAALFVRRLSRRAVAIRLIPPLGKRAATQSLRCPRLRKATFVKFALTGLGSFPSYYRYMADINRRGPDVLGGVPQPASLTPLSVRNQLGENALLVDARQERLFNEQHVPGAFAVPFGDVTSVSGSEGWLLPWRQPIILVPPAPAHQDAMVRQLIRIGYDRINGFLAGGFEAWKSAGLPTESAKGIDLETLKELSGSRPCADDLGRASTQRVLTLDT